MEHWNCHDHRDELMVSDHHTVYHPEHGQLSQVEKHWNLTLFHPIRFKEKSAAYAWVREGFIADLQEGLCNLGVGFSKESCVEREPLGATLIGAEAAPLSRVLECPSCGCTGHWQEGHGGFWKIYCRDCGVATAPMPTKEEAHKIWNRRQ